MAHILNSTRGKAIAFGTTLLLSATFYLPKSPSGSGPVQASEPVANVTMKPDVALGKSPPLARTAAESGPIQPQLDLSKLGLPGVRVVQVEDGKAAICAPPPAPVYDEAAISSNIQTLLVHQARLEAELQGRDDFMLPEKLQRFQAQAPTAQAFAEEQIVLRSRVKSLKAQIDAQAKAAAQAQHEIELMQAKAAVVDRQLALLRQRAMNVNALVARGITPAAEKTTAAQNVTQYEIVAYDLQLSIARSLQDKQTAERNSGDLATQRRDENTMDMVQTKAKLKTMFDQATVATGAQKQAEELRQRQASEGCGTAPHTSSYVLVPGPGSTMQVMRIEQTAEGSPVSQVVLAKDWAKTLGAK